MHADCHLSAISFQTGQCVTNCIKKSMFFPKNVSIFDLIAKSLKKT